MRASCRPAPNDKLPLADYQIDLDHEVREGGAKIVCDLLLAAGAGRGLSGPEIMADVIISEDLEREIGVPLVPDLLIEAAGEGLILLRSHGSPPPSVLAAHARGEFYAARDQRTRASAIRSHERRRLRSSASAAAASTFAGMAVRRASTAWL